MADTFTSASLDYWRSNPIAFIETCLVNPETGVPFELLPAERQFLEHSFQLGDNGKLKYSEWVYSCPKKSGKTTFEALVVLTMTLLYGGAFPESYILANSLEQGRGRRSAPSSAFLHPHLHTRTGGDRKGPRRRQKRSILRI